MPPPEPSCPDGCRYQEESSSSPQSDDRSERTLEHDQQVPEGEEISNTCSYLDDFTSNS